MNLKLLKNAQENKSDFVKIYDQYSDKIFRYLYFRTSDREKALDLMQETFTKTYLSLQKGANIEHIQAFLYRVANNLLIDDLKKRKSTSLEMLQENEGFQPSVDDLEETQQKLDTQQMLSKLDKLPDHFREIILLRYVDDLNINEIAEMLGETENSIRVKIHRAINKLRNILKKS